MSRPVPAPPLELMRMERDAWRREALANRAELHDLRLLLGVYSVWMERWRGRPRRRWVLQAYPQRVEVDAGPRFAAGERVEVEEVLR